MAQRNYGGGGIFMMPTIGEQIGPELQQLGKGIRDIIKPNYEIQAQLKQAIAQNPELLQRLIDLGPDKVGQIFGKEAAGLGIGEISMDKEIENASRDLFKNSPTFKTDIVASKTGTRRPDQVEKDRLTNESLATGIEGQKLGNRVQSVQANVAEQTEDTQIQQYQLAAEKNNLEFTRLQTAYNALNAGNIDITKAARDAANGRGDAQTMAHLQQLGINIGPLVDSLQQQRQISASFSLEKLRQQSTAAKVDSFAGLNQMVDNSRQAIQVYDSQMKGLQDQYKSALMQYNLELKKPAEERSALFMGSKRIVDDYNAAFNRREEAIDAFDHWTNKQNALGGMISAAPDAPDISEVVAPEYQPVIDGLRAMTPADRKIAIEELKTAKPLDYKAILPSLNLLDSAITKVAPKKSSDVMDSIAQGVEAKRKEKAKAQKKDITASRSPAVSSDPSNMEVLGQAAGITGASIVAGAGIGVGAATAREKRQIAALIEDVKAGKIPLEYVMQRIEANPKFMQKIFMTMLTKGAVK